MNTPKVAIMLPKLSRYGGVEQFGYRLAAYLAREFDVTFICARQEHEAPAGVRVVRIGRPPGKFCKMLWFALAAESARRRGNFDVSIGLGKSLRQDILRLSGGPALLEPFHPRLRHRVATQHQALGADPFAREPSGQARGMDPDPLQPNAGGQFRVRAQHDP
jgi:hypothetical protein